MMTNIVATVAHYIFAKNISQAFYLLFSLSTLLIYCIFLVHCCLISLRPLIPTLRKVPSCLFMQTGITKREKDLRTGYNCAATILKVQYEKLDEDNQALSSKIVASTAEIV